MKQSFTSTTIKLSKTRCVKKEKSIVTSLERNVCAFFCIIIISCLKWLCPLKTLWIGECGHKGSYNLQAKRLDINVYVIICCPILSTRLESFFWFVVVHACFNLPIGSFSRQASGFDPVESCRRYVQESPDSWGGSHSPGSFAGRSVWSNCINGSELWHEGMPF